MLPKISDVKINLFLKQKHSKRQEKDKNYETNVKDSADNERIGGKSKPTKRNIVSKPSDGNIPIKRAMLDENGIDNKAKCNENNRNDSDDDAKAAHVDDDSKAAHAHIKNNKY